MHHVSHMMHDRLNWFITRCRDEVRRVLCGNDDRLLAIVGPCSISDTASASEYYARLLVQRHLHGSTLLTVARVFFEKPRTIIGWKGLLVDPGATGTGDIALGLRMSRKLLQHANRLGLPTCAECLSIPATLSVADLLSCGAIGARTVESQPHRELASCAPYAILMKNDTAGNATAAVRAAIAARHEHESPSLLWGAGIARTVGNPDCTAVLRGGASPNYGAAHSDRTRTELSAAGTAGRVGIDASHGNSLRDHRRQALVCSHVALRLRDGERDTACMVMESHIHEGATMLPHAAYGTSVTDGCMGWAETVATLRALSTSANLRRARTEKRGMRRTRT
ncbi:Phospho-2-dehydro-3-deoxyheptonate aldolase, Phe-sensitive [Candidatus Tremblaya princeps]|uniref:Phospho-2-dehydro-3-deoxyheptonate aldolase n=1 Tax=Tremblaya princeps TaxID=189385 RepID=A0A143WNM1_TREPR|nr:Phospho-2-dehydro-3-deoxyheptonate aldolase, Phe-sensitive [Candidatus Tremblaya princeps]